MSDKHRTWACMGFVLVSLFIIKWAAFGSEVAAFEAVEVKAIEAAESRAETPGNPHRKVIVLLVDSLKEANLHAWPFPNLKKWTEFGGVGLMNANQPVDWSSINSDNLQVWHGDSSQSGAVVLDRTATELLDRADESTLVILMSPSPDPSFRKRELLPVLMAGGPIQPHSLLTSASTRRTGIVTSQDVAATVHKWLQMEMSLEQPGHMITGVRSEKDPWDALHRLASSTKIKYMAKPYFYIVFGLMGLFFFLLMAGVLYAPGLGEPGSVTRINLRNWALWGGTAVLTTPFVTLLLPYAEVSEQWGWLSKDLGGATVLAAVLAACTTGLMRIRNLLVRLSVIGFVTAGLVAVDVIYGGTLASGSILSYDSIRGARYYGVGNEYMAIFISSLLIGTGCVLSLRPDWRIFIKWGFAAAGMGMIVFLAAPGLGANAGGTIAAAVSVAVSLHHLFGWPKRVGGMAGVAIVAGAVLLLLVSHHSTDRLTHVSQAVMLAMDGHFRQIGQLIERKLAMNLELITLTLAGPVFLGVMLYAAVAVFRPLSWIKRFWDRWGNLQPFVTGGMAGALAGFWFNDSGVVVAVLMMLPLVYTVCMIRLAEAFPTPHTTVPEALSPLDTPDWYHGPDPGR
ncbi:hypothetical protein [Effusibacillus lacus]|uniref:Uncharacterized protein n=1 Tax=Effusibacillus lacus TaxID=1348429 RepID=A0A292YIR4_9BACL|nr:hypothetical protein [Effusibacillus lacus]TCS74334.1 hypothetical protein EDD64_11474 [Effusibacillus lacus]GAX88791.1 hypothetical protein EFBL_0405 [Effusibacillus lacus]